MALGLASDVPLKRARELAGEARGLRAEGVDPIEHRREQRNAARAKTAKAVTFKEAAEQFITSHEAGWKNPKHRQQWKNTLATYVYPVFGHLPVAEIDTALVMKVLASIWATKPETASRVRGRIEVILDAAKTQGQRSGENPARWKGHVANLLSAKRKVRRVRHHPALPYAAIPAFMGALRARPSLKRTSAGILHPDGRQEHGGHQGELARDRPSGGRLGDSGRAYEARASPPCAPGWSGRRDPESIFRQDGVGLSRRRQARRQADVRGDA